ncbi:MAG: hypothetical protein M1814_000064 [Vezdaea aestivalis]|nr:MAG: hypothetical protein M1814_000064 [Vezdaea aestivalis]
MTSHHPHEIYYEAGGNQNRSPGSHRQQQHNGPRIRPFDAYGQLPQGGLYTAEDHARYETNHFNRSTNHLPTALNGYDMNGTQTWNPNAFSGNGVLGGAATSRLRNANANARSRAPLPPTWLDPTPQLPNMPPYTNLGNGVMGPPQIRTDTTSSDPDDELIPTAIVIKNIPFAVKKEQLVQLMTDLGLPLPYAFNYHFDNGVFRGLAFANFTTAEETRAVIDVLNHFDLQGRKLRVEYKKMLPLAERERIEREKRERRGQLEEQHRPIQASALQNQPSMSSLSSAIRGNSPSPNNAQGGPLPNVDLNDPQHLQFYSQLLLFKDDIAREALIFPSTLSPHQRRIVHTIAHSLTLAHVSRGIGEQRQVHVYRAPYAANISPPLPQGSSQIQNADSRRGLNRAATIDFADARTSDNGAYNALRGQSSGLLNIPGSPGAAAMSAQNLRAAKSFADLRSFTPSPAHSTASFPTNLPTGLSRYTDYGHGPLNHTNQTPTSMVPREENLLSNGLSGMSIGSNIGPTNGLRESRSMFGYDRDNSQSMVGPIGSNRSFSTGFDEHSRARQSRAPGQERAQGYSARRQQNGHRNRGSDELNVTSGVEIVVE